LAAYPCIFIARKRIDRCGRNQVKTLTWDRKKGAIDTIEFLNRPVENLCQDSLENDGWAFSNNNELKLFQKIQSKGRLLEEIWPASVFYGVKTGCNEAFVINETTYNEIIEKDPKSKPLLNKIIRGRDVKKWILEYKNLRLIFIPRGGNIKDYPGIEAYLSQFRKILEPMPANRPKGEEWSGRKAGGYKWFELQDPVKYWKKFLLPKVVCPTLINKASFSVDDQQFFGNDKTTIIVTNKPVVLACLLNSAPIWWQMTRIAQTRQNGYYEVKPNYLRKLRFPVLSQANEIELENMGESVIQCVRGGDINGQKKFESLIDLYISKLFQLNDEEFSIIRDSVHECS